MSFLFNPTTGELERSQQSGAGGGVTYGRNEKIVDAAFLITPDITLDFAPSTNSDIVFLNGLQVGSACYSITGNIFSWINSADLREGDTLFIRYNG